MAGAAPAQITPLSVDVGDQPQIRGGHSGADPQCAGRDPALQAFLPQGLSLGLSGRLPDEGRRSGGCDKSRGNGRIGYGGSKPQIAGSDPDARDGAD